MNKAELLDTTSPAAARDLQVRAETRKIPEIVHRLNDWQYMERSIHRILAAWGRRQSHWDDKVTLHRHIWDQAEVIRRLRERVADFPGGKPDAPVAKHLQAVSEAVLFAPSFEDALNGIYQILLPALQRAYIHYLQHAHPVHDGPTLTLLHEINMIKEQQYFWFRDYRRRLAHETEPAYRAKILAAIDGAGGFLQALAIQQGESSAQPCGAGSGFRTPKYSNRPSNWRCEHDIMPFIRARFETDMETRRLWWATAYMLEMNLPDDQLNWLYWGHFMPWDWHHDISRHLWDESRHGHSGYSRLKDFGLDLHDVGFQPYNNEELAKAYSEGSGDASKVGDYVRQPDLDFEMPGVPMSPEDLYEAVFFIGMVAENGHFVVKNESYDDFREADDLESAEMMLFDIIDETKHVQYAHKWLPVLAEFAGVSNEDYRTRAASIRKQLQEEEDRRVEAAKTFVTMDTPARRYYDNLLERIRAVKPLQTDNVNKRRSRKPM